MIYISFDMTIDKIRRHIPLKIGKVENMVKFSEPDKEYNPEEWLSMHGTIQTKHLES